MCGECGGERGCLSERGIPPGAIFQCTECGGRGCEACGDTGRWRPQTCPARFVTPDIWEALALADAARSGAWPLAGGTLDQTRWFVEFCRFAWNEIDGMKAKLRIRD